MKVKVGDKVRFVQSGSGRVIVGWVLTVGVDGAMVSEEGKTNTSHVVLFGDIKEAVK